MAIVLILFLLLQSASFANNILHVEPTVLKNTPHFPIDKMNPWQKRATPADLRLINQYYRHPSITDKVPNKHYVNVNFIYALPMRSKNYADHLSGNTPLMKGAIADFITRHSNTDIRLDRRNFGFSIAFGSQLAYDVKGEFEFTFFQAVYIYNQYSGSTSTAGDSQKIQISYRENGTDLIAAFDNGEYIVRNLSLHYNLHKEFPDMLKGNSNTIANKITPFLIGGLGLTSRTHLLRLSSGILGNGNTLGSQMSEQNYFNIMPSFNLGMGIRYKINDTIAFSVKMNTIQVFNDWDFSNFIVQTGIVIFM